MNHESRLLLNHHIFITIWKKEKINKVIVINNTPKCIKKNMLSLTKDSILQSYGEMKERGLLIFSPEIDFFHVC